MKRINWDYKARMAWSYLTHKATLSATVTYTDVANHIGTTPRHVKHALGPIQDFCLDSNLPPLTVIVVDKNTGKPGTGFIAWDMSDLNSADQAVFMYPWNSIVNPFIGIELEQDIDALASALFSRPELANEVYSRIKVRGTAQKLFRILLSKVYNGCAFCGFSFPEALESAHIVSWASSNSHERLDPKNGILLCATHHRMFDSGWMTIDTNLTVRYCDMIEEYALYSEVDRKLTLDLNGQKIKLPLRKDHHPSLDYLKRHYAEKDWDSASL